MAAAAANASNTIEELVVTAEKRAQSLQDVPVAALSLSLNGEYGKLSEQMVVEIYDAMNERFLDLLQRSLPKVSRATLVWRLYFIVGAVLTASRQRGASMKSLSKGAVDGRNRKEMVRQLVAFAAAGFRAGEPPPERLPTSRAR